jgi:ribulose-phosphate 3-epimerase
LLTRAGSAAGVGVDGGVDAANAGRLVAAGATYLVAGTALFREPDLPRAIEALRAAATAGAAA